MNKKVLKTLEYDKVLTKLIEYCTTPFGKQRAERLRPYTTREEIEKEQSETADAFSRLTSFGSISMSGARNIRDSILRLRIQGSLSMSELLNISALLRCTDRVKAYGIKKEEEDTDSLSDYFKSLQPLVSLQKEIDRCIISEEEMADDASPALQRIRQKKQQKAVQIRQEMQKLVATSGSALQDQVITMRNGRYCLPVRQEARNQIPGMVHDESGSGSTVFIEPMSVVKLNNEIRELEIEEKKEIEVILRNLSEEAANYTEELDVNLKTLSHLDFVFAKALLARDMTASRPEFNDKKFIHIKNARHPLLDKKTVVPIDLVLGEDFTELIVTGPNTGGKTVSLKTMGLFQLMGQAGLHIPAWQGSKLGIFTEIFADIGDEQSIEQSLSTFSSHMKNIVYIVRHADMDSLVLLDELCSGTDPVEGAALAISILTFLKNMEVRVMATTHYSELKLFALSESRVENASSEFDVQTLSPTYRLLIGIPGKSNAFAISKKLGLPGYLIDEAKAKIDDDSMHFEDVIKGLNDTKKVIEKEKMEINELRAESKKLKDNLKRQQDKTESERQKILSQAKEEARRMLSDAKSQVDETIRLINKTGSTDVRELERARTETRALLEKHQTQEEKKETVQKSSTKAKDLHVGDSVKVLSMNLNGTVSTLPDKSGNLFVQMGILRSSVHISDVILVDEKSISVDGKKVSYSGSSNASIGRNKAMTISPEINLIGNTVDEAIFLLDKYLDDAYLSHLPQVRIVHGKGAGILRQAVQNHLRKQRYIKEYRSGEYGEGDAGVTIAFFK